MKITRLAYLLSVLPALLSGSCIAPEPANSECDILSVTLPDDDMLNNAPSIKNDCVEIVVKSGTPIESLPLTFTLTPGATINPPSGTPLNYRTPQTFVVTSEDGKWHKTYTIYVDVPKMVLEYNFENATLISASGGKRHYHELYEADSHGKRTLTWASANPSYVMTMQATDPHQFPTYQSEDGYDGKCVVLQTLSTGPFGAGMGKPIAAGSIFTGSFNSSVAMSNPLEATHFGENYPFLGYPLSIKGMYKYTPGKVYGETINRQWVERPDVTDEFNIFAILFATTPEVQYLSGSTIADPSNPAIIARADLDPSQRIAASEWTPFTIPFKLLPGRTIDRQKLASGGYNMVIVMSSSLHGDEFKGAIGSTLQIDQMKIECEQ